MKTIQSLAILCAVVALCTCATVSAYGAANTTTITAATGGSAISADNSTDTTPFTTALTGPSMACSSSARISTGTIILNCPSGFAWDTGGTDPAATVTGIGAVSFTTRTASQITYTVNTAVGNNSTLTFTGLRVKPSAGTPLANGHITRTGTATVSGQSSSNYGTLTEVVGAATQLAVTRQPSTTATAGKAFGTQPRVTVQDAYGNTVTAYATAVTAVETSGGNLNGTTTAQTATPSGGVATFNGLFVTNAASGVTLTFTSASLIATVSIGINVSASSASILAVTQQPSTTGTAGTPFTTQPQVTVLDLYGNTVSSYATAITAAETSGGNLNGNTAAETAMPSGGVATFSGLFVTNAASGVTLTLTSGKLTAATSIGINVSAAAASSLAFATQPSDTIFGTTIVPAVTVRIQDQFGNLTTSSANVAVALGNNPASGRLSGSLTVPASGGIATFGDLSINNIGSGYTLIASSSGLTAAASSSFGIIGFTVKTRVTGVANWSDAATWEKILSGKATFSTSSPTVTGTGTHFLSEVNVGEVLVLDSSAGVVGTVASIGSDTSLTLAANAATAGTSAACGKEVVPTASDDVQIGNTALGSAVSLTLDLWSATVNSLAFVADNLANTLIHSGVNSLTVNKDVTVNQPTANALTVAWNINGGSAAVGGNVTLGGANNTGSRVAKIAITSGSLTIAGNLTFTTGTSASVATLDLSDGAGTLNLGNGMILSTLGTLTPGTLGSTVNFNGTSAQTVPIGFSAVRYNNLALNNTSANGATPSAGITGTFVTGDLSVQSGTFNNGGFAVTLASAKSFSVSSGATFNLTGTSGMVTVSGGGTKTFGATSTVNYAGAAQSVSPESYGNVILSGSGAKSMAAGTLIGGNLSVAPTGSATASVGTGLNLPVGSLTLGGLGRANGTWGATAAILAAYHDDAYFAATTGYLTVYTDTRSTPTVSAWPSAGDITYGQTLASSTLSGGSASVPGSFAFTSPSTPPSAGTAPQSVTFTPTEPGIYRPVVGSASVTVNAAALLITANNASKPYGTTLTFAGTEFTPSGLVTGDSVTSVTLTSAGAAADAAVGAYDITPSAAMGRGLGNYTISYQVGTLTVVPNAAGIASDDFNRADGPLGANWAKPQASEGNIVVTGDQAGVDTENANCYAYWLASSFNDDQYSEVSITKILVAAWPGVIVRADSVQDRFYLGLVVGPNDYRIYARWDGGYYELANGTSETWQVGDTLKLAAAGSVDPVTVTMYHNGNPVLAWTSTGSPYVKAGGSPGIGIYSPSGDDLTLDNWEGGNLTAVPKLTFTTEPVSTTAGATLAPVVVQIQDGAGNNVAQSGTAITLNLNGGGTLGGTVTRNSDANGQATFDDLTITRSGSSEMLVASSPGLTSATSGAFEITPAVAIAVNVETKSDGSASVMPAQYVGIGQTITGYAITRDQYGNFVANVAADWSLPTMTGGVAGSDLVAASDGKSAAFTGHLAGTATIRATSAGLSSTDSGTLTVIQTVVVSDDFDRADGPLGASWSKPPASGGNMVVTGDQAGVDTENAHCYAYWSANSFNDDQYSQATITKIGPWTGVILRTDSTLDRFYLGFVFAPNDYRIYARWDGAYYSLVTGSSETWLVGDALRLEVSGSENPITITMYRNGTPVLQWVSTSDDQVRTGGSPGIGIYSPSGDGLTLDNWEGGNLVSLPTLTVTGITAQSKVYDGTTAATLVGLSQAGLVGVQAGDVVTLDTTQAVGAFSDPNVGTGKVVQVSDLALAGADAAKYKLLPPTLTADITPANAVVTSWPTASDIAYGQTLTDSALSGGTATTDGTFAFTIPSTVPNVGTALQSVTFTAANYNPVAGAVDVTVYATVGSVIAIDDFNRPDGNLGVNWTAPLASVADLVITNEQVGVSAENTYCYACWSANSFNDDQYSEATITKIGPWPGVIVRADSNRDGFYLGLLVGPNDYRIYLETNGAYSLLATGGSQTWQVGDTLKLDAAGSANPVTVTMYRNGSSVLSWTSSNDADVITGGSPGIGIYSPTGDDLTLDNWEGGSLGSPVP